MPKKKKKKRVAKFAFVYCKNTKSCFINRNHENVSKYVILNQIHSTDENGLKKYSHQLR